MTVEICVHCMHLKNNNSSQIRVLSNRPAPSQISLHVRSCFIMYSRCEQGGSNSDLINFVNETKIRLLKRVEFQNLCYFSIFRLFVLLKFRAWTQPYQATICHIVVTNLLDGERVQNVLIERTQNFLKKKKQFLQVKPINGFKVGNLSTLLAENSVRFSKVHIEVLRCVIL